MNTLKTPSAKKFNDYYLKSLIVSCIDLSGYDEFNQDVMTIKQQAQAVLGCFSNEFEYPANIAMFPNKIERIADWLRGLPSSLTIPFYNCDIIRHSIKSGYLSEDSQERAQGTCIDNWFKIMAGKLEQLSRISPKAEKTLLEFMQDNNVEY